MTTTVLLERKEGGGIKPKFSRRASWLINGESDESTISIFRAIYTCRCDAVHDGILKDNYNIYGSQQVTALKLIEDGTILALELVKKIIEYGSVPKWAELTI